MIFKDKEFSTRIEALSGAVINLSISIEKLSKKLESVYQSHRRIDIILNKLTNQGEKNDSIDN